jgi:hypothetical protein
MRRVRRTVASALLFAVAAAGCGHRALAPETHADVIRNVAVVVRDSLGQPLPWMSVTALAQFDVAGSPPWAQVTADSNGVATFKLRQGPWSAVIRAFPEVDPPPRKFVAASTFSVPYRTRPESDTLVVRLTTSTASRATGTTGLGDNFHDWRYTSVFTSEYVGNPTSTNSAGNWALDDLPPGTWTIRFSHDGYTPVTRTVTITTPGSDVTVPEVLLAR